MKVYTDSQIARYLLRRRRKGDLAKIKRYGRRYIVKTVFPAGKRTKNNEEGD